MARELKITAFGRTLYECKEPKPKPEVKPPVIEKILPKPIPIERKPEMKKELRKVEKRPSAIRVPEEVPYVEEPVIVPEEAAAVSGYRKEGRRMAMELIEMGVVRPELKLARTPQACRAAGGIVRKAPPWSAKRFVCASPPPWYRGGIAGYDGCVGAECGDLGIVAASTAECRAKGGIVRKAPPWSRMPFVCAKPRRRRMGDVGFFARAGAPCPPGYRAVTTTHPRWGKGTFQQCVKRGGGLGQIRMKSFLPKEIKLSAILIGDGVGILVSTVSTRLLSSLIADPTTAAMASRGTKVGLGVLSTAGYFATKSSFMLGAVFGTLPGAIDTIANAIADLATGRGLWGLAGTSLGARVGQLTSEEIKALERAAGRLAGDSGVGQYGEEEEGTQIPLRPLI